MTTSEPRTASQRQADCLRLATLTHCKVDLDAPVITQHPGEDQLAFLILVRPCCIGLASERTDAERGHCSERYCRRG